MGGAKDVSAAWTAGVLAVDDGSTGHMVPEAFQELWEERTAIMVYDANLPRATAKRLAVVSTQGGHSS